MSEDSYSPNLVADTDAAEIVVSEPYLASYRAHLSQTRDHLAGRDEDGDESEGEGYDELYNYDDNDDDWSPSEKDLFFHGLRVHSGLRPDLIAHQIGTRNVLDVCAYIDVLDKAVAYEAQLAADSGPSRLRSEVDFAKEVSERWVDREEKYAAALCKVEEQWDEHARVQRRAEEVKRGGGKGQMWEREDALRVLGLEELKVLESIIRAKETTEEEEKILVAPTTSGEISLAQRIHADPELANIDPVLLALDPPTTAVEVPLDLSPATRRRIQKRLHMRRKRARERGEEASLEMGKLKTAKRRKVDEGARSGEVEQGKRGLGEERVGEPAEASSPTVPRGKTSFYKIKDRFEEVGVTPDSLRADGVDLFHLGTLAKLMEIYNVVHADPDLGPSLNTTLNLTTIHYLHAHLVAFVTEAIHRAVVARELEMRLKEGLKIWKTKKADGGHFPIPVACVEQVLDVMCERRKAGLNEYLGGLEHILVAREKSTDGEGTSGADTSGEEDHHAEGVEDDQGSLIPENEGDALTGDEQSLHRKLYPPFVRLPSAYTSTASPAEDSEDIDESIHHTELEEEGTLQAELDDDEELNALDEAAEREFERRLWVDFKGQRIKSQEGPRVKSRKYIEDSDE